MFICLYFIFYFFTEAISFICFKDIHNFSLKHFIVVALKSLWNNSHIFVFLVLSSIVSFSFSLRFSFLVQWVIFLLKPGYVCIVLWEWGSYLDSSGSAGFFKKIFFWTPLQPGRGGKTLPCYCRVEAAVQVLHPASIGMWEGALGRGVLAVSIAMRYGGIVTTELWWTSWLTIKRPTLTPHLSGERESKSCYAK